MTDTVTLRKGEARDADTIAAYNTAMALETEHRVLRPERVGPGVRRLIADPSLGFYLVAERAGEVVGCLLVTNEWSDWRNGLFWWIQSVYVAPGARRQGVYRQMYDHVRAMAAADPGICGFRLYVEKDNTAAQRTYRSLGMAATDYLIFEEPRAGVDWFGPPAHP
jgi:ribosomal protein S18 acetylase RimI-like enzyme